MSDRHPMGGKHSWFGSFPFASAILCLILILVGSPSGFAQDGEPSIGEGTHVFRRLLYDLDLRSIPVQDSRGLADSERVAVLYEALERLMADPEHEIAILFGDVGYLDRKPFLIDRFLRLGGALMLATDRRTSDTFLTRPPLLFSPSRPRPATGIFVTGESILVPQNSPSAYRQSADCIYVKPMGKGGWLLEGLPHVATNMPSRLSGPLKDLEALAKFPDDAFVEDQQPDQELLFAAGGDRGPGRLLVLADHSLFINAMLCQSDNDNVFFAQNCVRWLAEGKRTRVLLVNDRKVETQFNIPLKPPPMPPLESMVGAVDQGLQSLEEEDRFNRFVQGAVTDLNLSKLLSTAAVVATILAAFYGLSRLSLMRQRPSTDVPALETYGVQQLSPLPLPAQRTRELLRRGNYHEPARALLRNEFETILGPGVAAAGVKSNGNWLIRRKVDRLWRIAYGEEPENVSSKELAALKADIQRLRDMIQPA